MLGDKIYVQVKGYVAIVTNITNEKIYDCFITVKNNLGHNIFEERFDLLPYEEKKCHFNMDFVFKGWDSNRIKIKIFSKHKKIYDAYHWERNKCFVTYSNKEYEGIAEQLFVGLNRYSNVDILHFTIDYDSSLVYDNLTNVRLDDLKDGDILHIQLCKPHCLLKAIEHRPDCEYFVFIDTDILVRRSVDNFFEGLVNKPSHITMQRSWDYIWVNGKQIPGDILKNYFDVTSQPYPYSSSNIIMYSRQHENILKDWLSYCIDENIIQMKKEGEFLNDEVLLNLTIWKNNQDFSSSNFGLFWSPNKEKDIIDFYTSKNLSYNDKQVKYDLTFTPNDKEEILCFHGEKDVEACKRINQMIYDFEYLKKPIPNSIYRKVEKQPVVHLNDIDGMYAEIKSGEDKEYKVDFIDMDLSDVTYSTTIKPGNWVKTNIKYYKNWQVKITSDFGVHLTHNMSLKGKRVYISIDSSSLGDNIAWFPYAEEFRKQHQCQVIVSTFHNKLFEAQYPELIFVSPGEVVQNIFAKYSIGWYYTENRYVNLTMNPVDFRPQPMQKTASDILGLTYSEVKPIITNLVLPKKKQISIAIHGTAQAKYWNNMEGWQKVVDWCISKGYTVKLLSSEEDGYMGNYHPKGIEKHPNGDIQLVIEELLQSEAFIGIGSGLSWLAWACDIPTILISGFSEDYTEPTSCYRVAAPEGVCSGCFNKHALDPSDWNWCPIHKNTDRMFECSKSITPKMVTKKLKEVLKKNK